jgi:hypothetical protein
VELLQSERENLSAPMDAQNRVAARLALTIAAPLGAPPASPVAPAKAAATSGLGGATSALVVKAAVLATTFALGAGVGAGVHAHYNNPTPSYRESSFVLAPIPWPIAVSPSPSLSEAPSAQAAPAMALDTRAPDGKAIRSAGTLPSASADTGSSNRDSDLAAERAILETARTAVARGNGASALAAVQRHIEQFPRGRLAEEREVIAIQALVSLGRLDEARQRAARFKSSFPRSMAIPAVQTAVGSTP